jgi:hypothetical protein
MFHPSRHKRRARACTSRLHTRATPVDVHSVEYESSISMPDMILLPRAHAPPTDTVNDDVPVSCLRRRRAAVQSKGRGRSSRSSCSLLLGGLGSIKRDSLSVSGALGGANAPLDSAYGRGAQSDQRG